MNRQQIKILKNAILFIFGLAFLFAGLACDSILPFGPKEGDNVKITFSISLPDSSVAYVDKVILKITAADMDTISKQLTLQNGVAAGDVDVPLGKQRTFTIIAYSGINIILTGSTTSDLEAGNDVKLSISLSSIKQSLNVSAVLPLIYGYTTESALYKAKVTVEADTTVITQDMNLVGLNATASILLNAGNSRHVTVTIYKGDTTPILQGTATVNVEAAKSKDVTVSLNQYLLPSLVLNDGSINVHKDVSFEIYVSAQSVIDLATIGAKIQFDTTKLSVVDITRIDDFMESNSGTIFPLKFSKDNTEGKVDIQLAIFPATGAVSGTGNICKIKFMPKATGSTEITLSTDNVSDSNLGLYDKTAALITSLSFGSGIEIN